jgi:hypothetical protein
VIKTPDQAVTEPATNDPAGSDRIGAERPEEPPKQAAGHQHDSCNRKQLANALVCRKESDDKQIEAVSLEVVPREVKKTGGNEVEQTLNVPGPQPQLQVELVVVGAVDNLKYETGRERSQHKQDGTEPGA